VYPTSDGEMLLIAANQDTVFARLADAMDRPELARDPHYATHLARGAHQAELDALLSEWSATLPAQELLERLARHGVPSGRIYRAPEMLDDEHFKARAAIVSVPHPDFGELRMQNVVPKLSATPGGIRSPSPQLGEHNDATYLGLLGLKAERYAELKKMKVI
jgi:formyl-CoA transferase